jgi:hypothetical protein
VYPKGSKRDDSLSIYLEVAQINQTFFSFFDSILKETSERLNRDVIFSLFVLNQLDTNGTITKKGMKLFIFISYHMQLN